MVAPEGDKLLVILPILLLLVASGLYLWKRKNIKLPIIKRRLKIRLEKNKIYRPTVIHLNVQNTSKSGVSIENPIIRFKKIWSSKAFKIKSVNTQVIYPLYLEAGESHRLPISLEPFYSFNKRLKRYPRIRIEFTFDKTKSRSSNYIFTKSTIFRKVNK